jgi:hypothetical protein
MPRFCRYSCSYSCSAIVCRFGDSRSELSSGGVVIKHEEWTRIPLLSELRDKLETEFHTTFNAVHCSYFRNGTRLALALGWPTHKWSLMSRVPPSFFSQDQSVPGAVQMIRKARRPTPCSFVWGSTSRFNSQPTEQLPWGHLLIARTPGSAISCSPPRPGRTAARVASCRMSAS